MIKPTRLLIFFLCAFALALSACGALSPGPETTATLTPTSTPEPTDAPTAIPTPTEAVVKGTVTLWHSWDESKVPALLRRIDAFRKIYPQVNFDVTYIPDLDLRGSFEAAAGQGGGPSILIGPAEWGPGLYDKGWVVDLSSLASADVLNTLNPPAVGAGRYKDALIGLPVDIQGVVLYRNKSIVPIAPESFDELVTLSQQATQGEMVGADLERSFFYSGGHLYGLGGELMTPDGQPAFNTEKGLEWIGMLQTFSQAGPTEFSSDNDLNLFMEGRVGFIIDGTWNRGQLSDALGAGNLSIDPWPVYAEGKLSGFVQAENIYLASNVQGEDRTASWLFAEFLLSPESQMAVADVGMIPAISGSPASGAAAEIEVSDPLIQEAMLALVDGATYPVIPEMSVYTSPMDVALKSVFDGGVSPADALQTAADTISQALDVLHTSPTPSP